MKFNNILLLLIVLVILSLAGCNETDDPTLTKQSIFGNWNLVNWERTDSNPNADGNIFGVYCNDVHFLTNDSVKFYFGHNLLVSKGTWSLLAPDNLISIQLEGRDTFTWKILTTSASRLEFEEQTYHSISNESITIRYELENE